MKVAEMEQALGRFLVAQTGAEVRVGGLSRLAGGASCDVYSFEAKLSPRKPPGRYVLRIDAPAKTVLTDRRREFELLQAAGETGVRVPEVLWFGREEAGLGGNFVVMEFVDGEAIARRLLRDDRYSMTRHALPSQLAEQLSKIHSIPLDHPALKGWVDGQPQSGSDATDAVEHWQQILAVAGAGHPWPVLELVARWLIEHAPAGGDRTLVHGDFRVGNVMFDHRGLKAILDWELAHIGDPIEDLGWFCVRSWRFGADHRAAGGLCSREEFAHHYQRASGRRVDVDRLRYWEIFGNWKWAIASIGQEASHKGGAYPNVELAAIGRRVCEMEQEMLTLIEST